MKATDIKKGKRYAAVSYGRPRSNTSVFQCRVIAELDTRKGAQQEFKVQRTKYLNRDWQLQDDETGRLFRLKSGRFYMPWEEFEEVIQEQRKKIEERKKQAEEREAKKEATREHNRELVRALAELTGVELISLEDLDKDDHYGTLRRLNVSSIQVDWDDIAALIDAFRIARHVSDEATQGAIDLLDDVF